MNKSQQLLEEMDAKTGEPKDGDMKDEKDPKKKKKKKDDKKPKEKAGASTADFFKKKDEPEEGMNKSQQLLAELGEGSNKENHTVKVTSKNKDAIKRALKSGNSGEIDNAKYDVYMTGVKNNKDGVLNIDIISYVDSPTMKAKFKKEIFKKLGLS